MLLHTNTKYTICDCYFFQVFHDLFPPDRNMDDILDSNPNDHSSFPIKRWMACHDLVPCMGGATFCWSVRVCNDKKKGMWQWKVGQRASLLCVKLGGKRQCIFALQIRIGLNHVVEKANKIIVDRHFLTGVEDRGQLSCHKVVVR